MTGWTKLYFSNNALLSIFSENTKKKVKFLFQTQQQ